MVNTIDPERAHPSFTRAAALSNSILRHHFPKSAAEALSWHPMVIRRALDRRVLVVARTRVECAWSAYCSAVPGINHSKEFDEVIRYGSKLDESLARALFPIFDEVPYAD